MRAGWVEAAADGLVAVVGGEGLLSIDVEGVDDRGSPRGEENRIAIGGGGMLVPAPVRDAEGIGLLPVEANAVDDAVAAALDYV